MFSRVSISATSNQQAVHVEDDSRPNSLLFAVEEDDEPAAPLFRRTYRFLLGHPPRIIRLYVSSRLSYRRRRELISQLVWLLRKLLS